MYFVLCGTKDLFCNANEKIILFSLGKDVGSQYWEMHGGLKARQSPGAGVIGIFT